ncbi:MAG: efflux RND transporter periplasmic adaptor subunit [Alkalispirochaeta sp.]
MKRPRLLLSAVIAGVTLIFVGSPLIQLVMSMFEEEQEVRGVPVRLAFPERSTLSETARYSGSLTADRTANVVARHNGEVISIAVDENEEVEAGDTIAEIEDDSARLEVEQARANLEMRESRLRAARRGAREEEVENARANVSQAESEIETAERELERTRRLAEAGTVSQSQLEAAENEFRGAQTELENARRQLRILEEGATEEDLDEVKAAVRAAERQLDLAELQLRYTTVRAPVSGRVTIIDIEEGNMVDVGTPVARIVGDDFMRASIPVPEGRYDDFASDEFQSEVTLEPASYAGSELREATVSHVGSSIDPATRTFEVEILANNEDGSLRPGMYVEARFTLRERRDVLIVPDRAVVNREGREVVFAVDKDEETREIEVKTGLSADGHTEVSAAGDETIDENTQVVVEGNSFLEHEQTVRIVEGP